MRLNSRFTSRAVAKKNWSKKRLLLTIGGVILGVLLAVQLAYPASALLPFTKISNIKLGGWQKQDAAWELNSRANKQSIAIKLGDSKSSYDEVKPVDIGLKIDNKQQIQSLEYPWYMRLVPTSLFWYAAIQADGKPEYIHEKAIAKTYVTKELGNCDLPAKNASLEYKSRTLEVILPKEGGSCKADQAVKLISSVQPKLDEKTIIKIPGKTSQPKITKADATKLKNILLSGTKQGLKLAVADKQQTLDQQTLLSWMTFSEQDNKITYSLENTKSVDYFAKSVTPLVVKPAGQTKITTQDFSEIGKEVGATGQTAALPATLESIKTAITGNLKIANVVVTSLEPKVSYTRTYTSTSNGIAALLAQYDQDHPGNFSATFQELGGRGLSAQYNGNVRTTTASTYKLFVAYGTLRKIDAGEWKWSDADIAGGRNLTTCFDDMIVKSDNPCAESLLRKLGLSQLTKDIAKEGLNNSGFTLGSTPLSTSNDLTGFLVKLENNQLGIKPESRERFLSALKRNVYVQGIPAGASGQVANKVGFLNGLLHDAAIVYSPKGTYVLTIMTDGSSWAAIADLTKQIEALR